jgi:hypothetical protein
MMIPQKTVNESLGPTADRGEYTNVYSAATGLPALRSCSR